MTTMRTHANGRAFSASPTEIGPPMTIYFDPPPNPRLADTGWRDLDFAVQYDEVALMRKHRDIMDLVRRVRDAARHVYKVMGPGYKEEIYEAALAIELEERDIPVVRQRWVAVSYGGHQIGTKMVDLFVDGRLAVEIKTKERLDRTDEAQAITSGKELEQPSLLVNFPTEAQGAMRDETGGGNKVPEVRFKDRFIPRVGR